MGCTSLYNGAKFCTKFFIIRKHECPFSLERLDLENNSVLKVLYDLGIGG